MANIFDLAPEGQAWTDNLSEGQAAGPDDYSPSFFAGSATALPRGIAEGTIGLGQTVTGFGKQIISDPKTMMEWAPTYGILKSMFPQADEALNSAYDSTAKSMENARQAVKPDPTTQGTAAHVLEGLGQFAPAIGATVVGGPTLGGAVAFGSTFEPSRQDFLKKGVDADTATTLATEQASMNALGMALPAGVGGGLATRLLSGVGINTTFGAINRYSVSETLEDHGYADMAKQYQVWDKQAIAVDAVLGLTFGGVHHWASSRGDLANATDPVTETPPPAPESSAAPNDGTTVTAEPSPAAVGESAAPVADAPAPETTATAEPSASYDSRLSELQELAGQLLPVADRKALAAQIHQGEYSLSQIEAQRQALRDQRIGNSSSRRIRNRDMAALDQQAQELNSSLEPQRQALADNSRGGKFFEAKADLSRIDQGIIPESMRDFIEQTPVKPSDVDAAHVLNEGLSYDLESAPIIHGTNESINAHVSAMDEATRSLLNGEPVNVSQQIRGLDGVVRPDIEATGSAQRDSIVAELEAEGVPTQPPAPDNNAAEITLREGSAFSGARDNAGEISRDPDTGDVLSGNSYDLMNARDLAADPEVKILHPDTGKEVTLSEALADLDEQIATAKSESNAYSVAAACFLRNL